MTGSDSGPRSREAFIDRRARKIASSRSVTLGLALTFLGLALIGAIVIRLADRQNFPSLGLAVWWALQTVTTVGYGDIVPTSNVGRVIGGAEMVLGVSFFAFLTAIVTSTVTQRAGASAQQDDREHREHNTQRILDALTEAQRALAELDTRIAHIESRIAP
jgi:voltage-gated potassium channel